MARPADSAVWIAGLALLAAPALAMAEPAPAPPPASKAPAKPKTVEAVTVTAAGNELQTSIDRKSFAFGKDLQATVGSIADALRSVPSVEVDLQGNLSLRGDPNVTILVDGKPSPMFEGPGRADALQQLAADQFERVEVITNPSAALNPEGSGGVINLISKKSRGAGVTGSTYATVGTGGLKREGLTLGYNSAKLNVTASLSGNYQRNKFHADDLRGGLDPSSGRVLNNEFQVIGRNLTRGPTARLNLGYALDSKTQLTFSGQFNQLLVEGHPYNRFFDDGPDGSRIGDLIRQGERRFVETDTGLTAGWKHTFAEGHDLSLDLVSNESDGRDHNVWQTFLDIGAPVAAFEAIQDNADQRHSELRLGYDRPLPGGASLKTGYELKYDDNDYDYTDVQGAAPAALAPVPALANHFLFKQTINAGFATYERPVGDLDVLAGLRIEDVRLDLDQITEGKASHPAYTKVYPTLHLTWKLDDERKLSASVSERVQRPPPVLMNPRRYLNDPKNVQQGNPELKPQETQAFELGFEQRRGQSNYLATLYYRRNVGAFSQVLIDLGDGVFETTWGNFASSRTAGLELVASGKLSKTLGYSANANLYWSEISAQNLGFGGPRSAYGVSGRGNLDWQVRPDDLVQLNTIVFGKRLVAQGIRPAFATVNLGWRHKFDDRITATVTVQDLFASTRFGTRLNTPVLSERFDGRPLVRGVFIRLDYRFGGGGKGKPAKDPAFEYENAAPPPG